MHEHVQPLIICRWQYMWCYRYNRVMPLFDVTVSFRYRIMWTRSLPLLAYFSHYPVTVTRVDDVLSTKKPHLVKFLFYFYMESLNIFMHVQVDQRSTLRTLSPLIHPHLRPWQSQLDSAAFKTTILLCEFVCSKTKYLVGNCCLLSVHVLTSARYHSDV